MNQLAHLLADFLLHILTLAFNSTVMAIVFAWWTKRLQPAAPKPIDRTFDPSRRPGPNYCWDQPGPGWGPGRWVEVGPRPSKPAAAGEGAKP